MILSVNRVAVTLSSMLVVTPTAFITGETEMLKPGAAGQDRHSSPLVVLQFSQQGGSWGTDTIRSLERLEYSFTATAA